MKIIYVNRGVKKNYTKEDHRSYIYTQLLQLRKDSLEKKIRLVRDSNPWPLRYRCSALPILHCKSQLGAGRWISLDVYNKRKKFTCLWLKSYNKHSWRLFWLFIHQETIYNCWPSQCMNWYRMTVGVGTARVHKKWRGLFLLLLHFFLVVAFILKLPTSTPTTVQTS